MSTFGFPADSFAQSDFRPGGEPAPPAPNPPEGASGPSNSPLPVPHDKAVAWEAPVVTTLPVGVTA